MEYVSEPVNGEEGDGDKEDTNSYEMRQTQTNRNTCVTIGHTSPLHLLRVGGHFGVYKY